MPNRLDLPALAQWLTARDDFALFAHVNPDGDTIGCVLAMARILTGMGKRVFACIPGGLTKTFSVFETTAAIIAPGEDAPFPPKTAFALDVSDYARLGEGKTLFESCAESALLDHHGTNVGFGDVFYIDGEAAATGELVIDLAKALGAALDTESATWLHIAISTDSGNFCYSSTREKTFESAATLIRTGFDLAECTRRLYKVSSEGHTRLLGRALSRMERSDDGRMAWSYLTKADFADCGAKQEDNDGIINFLLEIDGVEFACLAEERGANVTKFSLRSKLFLDVANSIAKPMGGGGHARAAGVTLEKPLEEALSVVLDAAKRALNG